MEKAKQYINTTNRAGHLIADPGTYEPMVYSPCCPLVSKPLPKGSGTGTAGGLNIWAV